MSIDKQHLCNFLVKAKRATYAAGDMANKIINEDHSTTLIFEEGDWKYHDNYFGGEPFGGREVVLFQNTPIYIMTYYGKVDETIVDCNQIYKTLQNALLLIPHEHPYRGPREYIQENYKYINNFTGEVDNFFGEEIIMQDGKEIYKTRYNGGFVDQRK